jgi:hydrogenase maturation protease
MKKEIIVVGIGSLLMTDEGVGCKVVEHFMADSEKYPNVEFVDIGTGGFSLLHLIADRKKAIFIDCAKMGTEPGTIKRFTPDDVNSVKKLLHYSLHEADILKVIEISRSLGQCPRETVIFGIEPKRIEIGRQLSVTLNNMLNDYIVTVEQELGE